MKRCNSIDPSIDRTDSAYTNYPLMIGLRKLILIFLKCEIFKLSKKIFIYIDITITKTKFYARTLLGIELIVGIS